MPSIMNKHLFSDTQRSLYHKKKHLKMTITQNVNRLTILVGRIVTLLEIVLILVSAQTKWVLLKMTLLTNILASPASSCTSPCCATELRIHAVGCALIHHIMNIEINTKWLNNSSGDRAC